MILSVLRLGLHPQHLAAAGLALACAASVACSNSSNPPADAYIGAQLGGGVACPFPSPIPTWLDIGTATGGKPTTVADQGSTGNGTASITCVVHPSGNGFDIQLEAVLQGANGGNVTITSPQGAGAVTTSGSTSVTASFYNNVNGGAYVDQHCVLTYKYMGGAVPISPPIAAGRIWGHITCPNAVDTSGQTKQGADGGATTATCPASADFLFEQCGQ